MNKKAKENPGKEAGAGTSTARAPQAKDEAIVENSAKSKESPCVVVGVGASAGGLEAFTELLKPLPNRPGMAFVLIPHLDPKHESAMTELLSRGTSM